MVAKLRGRVGVRPKPAVPEGAPEGFDWRPKNTCDKVFFYLLFPVSLILRVIWLDMPRGSLIFDEKYYVNVARILLWLPHDPDVYVGAPLGVDTVNREHPLLAKLIIALSIKVFGDNAWGWRIPSVVFGMASLLIFYLLMKRVSKSPRLALLASFLFSFDNLVFVHSRVATLDIFVLAFMLLGFYWYFQDRMDLSAFALALSTLSKIGGLYGFATVVAYHFLHDVHEIEQPEKGRGKKPRKRELSWYEKLRIAVRKVFTKEKFRWFERFLIVYALSSLILMFVMSRVWAGYSNPIDHIIYIYNYTLGLTRPAPLGIESYPWQWLLNEVQIPYLKVDIKELPSGRILGTMIAFMGAMNPLIIYLTLPAMAYVAYKYCRKGGDFQAFTLAWFIFTYLPFYPLSVVGHRISYLFYFLNTVPSVCAAVAYTLMDRNPPKVVLALYIIAVLAGFASLFPFKQIP